MSEIVYEFRPPRSQRGEYYSGIPARNLSADDLRALADEQVQTVETCGLYRKVEPPKDEAPADANVAPDAPADAKRAETRGGKKGGD